MSAAKSAHVPLALDLLLLRLLLVVGLGDREGVLHNHRRDQVHEHLIARSTVFFNYFSILDAISYFQNFCFRGNVNKMGPGHVPNTEISRIS